MTVKLMSSGVAFFSGHSDASSRLHRAHVGVEVHLEAHAQQNFFGVDVGGHARIAERADEDGIEVARQHLEAVGGDGGAVDEIAVGAPVEAGELDGGARGANHFQRVGNDFLADAVSGNNCDAFGRVMVRGNTSRKQLAASNYPLATSMWPQLIKIKVCHPRRGLQPERRDLRFPYVAALTAHSHTLMGRTSS